MLNSYIKLLQHAAEAITNVSRSNAGAAEYFQAVGYEFVIIAIGLLYLAGIAAIVAVPVLVFRQGVYKGGFASKTLKKFSEIVLDCDKARVNIVVYVVLLNLVRKSHASKPMKNYVHCSLNIVMHLLH